MPYPKTATSKPAKGSRVINTKPSNTSKSGSNLASDVVKFAPGWKVRDWGGPAMKPGLRTQWRGRQKVLLTHPLSKTAPCVLSRKIDVPRGKKTILELEVTNHPMGNWRLGVLVNGKEALSKDITETKWRKFQIDLSKHAGKTVSVELLNQATGWSHEAAYWSRIKLVH